MIGSYIRKLVEFDTETRNLTELGFFSVASGPAVLLGDMIYVVRSQSLNKIFFEDHPYSFTLYY